jgi:ankyrin repeat protein
MTVAEIAEAIAVNHEDQHFQVENRLRDVLSVLDICSSLVTISETRTGASQAYSKGLSTELRLAHYSIKEYIISNRIRTSSASTYAVEKDPAHEYIARVCIIYLSGMNKRGSLHELVCDYFPLLRYAARYWYEHLREVTLTDSRALELGKRLFDLKRDASFINWLRIHDPDASWDNIDLGRTENLLASPLYYAALLNLPLLTRWCLDQRKDVNAVNVVGGRYGSVLQAAALTGNAEVVRLLIENGASVHIQSGEHGSALQAAVFENHAEIAQILIDNGADPNARCGGHTNALYTSAVRGHVEVMNILITNGAELEVQKGGYGNPLYAAAVRGHESAVRVLAESGANINVQGGGYGTALYAAATQGFDQVVKVLIEHGADVDIYEDCYGNALQAAASGGHIQVVKLLIESHIECDIQSKGYAIAIFVAAANSHHDVIDLLLQKSESLKELYTLSLSGDRTALKELADRRLNLNSHELIKINTALVSAAFRDDEEVLKILIEREPDLSFQGGRLGNALQAAALAGHINSVQLLVEKGADVTAEGGEHGSALQAAAFNGHEAIVKYLIEKGADVNAPGGYYGNALQAASRSGFLSMVQFLFDAGADVNAKGGRYNNALQAATFGGHTTVVELLMQQHQSTTAIVGMTTNGDA